jgi:hypothetical protein
MLSKYKSRYETQYDTQYDTGYRNPDLTKESRSIDRAENLTEPIAKDKTFEDEDPKPVPNNLLKKDQFEDDLFNLHHLPINQDQDQL